MGVGLTRKNLAKRLRLLRPFWGTILFGLAGAAINLFPLEIFPGVHLVFGCVFSIAAAVLFGPVAGFSAGFVAGLPTWWLWQQPLPYSAGFYALEGVWVGFASRRGQRGSLVPVLLYWLLVGVWLNAAVQFWVIKFPPVTVLIIQIRSLINGLLAGLAVEVGWAAADIARCWLSRSHTLPRLTLESVITLLLTVVITAPLLFMLTHNAKEVGERTLNGWAANAVKEVESVKEEVAALIASYERGVATAGAMVKGQGMADPALMQKALSAVRSQYPEFAGMYVADAAAKTIAFDPLTNSVGQSLIGLSYGDRQYYRELLATKSTVYSGVYQARGGMVAPAVAIGVPILRPNQELAGFVLGWFDVNRLNHIFSRYRGPGLEMVMADKEGRLICASTFADGSYQKVTDISQSREFRQASVGWQGRGYLTGRGLSDSLPFGILLRGGEHFAYATVPMAGWKVWYKQLLMPLKEQLSWIYLNNLLTIVAMLVLAHFLSKVLARALTLPLAALEKEALEVASGNLSARARPKGLLTAETGSLFLSFNKMARSLNASVQELRRSEERFRSAFDYATIGMALAECGGRMIQVNAALCRIVGYDEDELLRLPFQSLVHPEDRGKAQEQIELLASGKKASFVLEKRCLHKQGQVVWVYLSGSLTESEAGQNARLILQFQDITERKRSEERLLHDAFHDALTGLPNRTLFLDHLRLALERAGRHPERRFAVLFLDLDRFKILNDSLGHLAGDQFLIEVAQRLSDCLRAGDTVARLGGDEFTVLIEEVTGLEEVKEVAARIQSEMTRPFMIKGQEVFTAASIGIALGGPDYQSPEELLRDADTAMYRAKSQGPGRLEVFDQAMHAQAVRRLQLEADLVRALERGEFTLHYQPIVSLSDGRLAGFEALARWHHPQEGMVSPTKFIPVAEETGLIVQLGEWALREACRAARRWHDLHPRGPSPWVSVNLSIRQFVRQDLPEKVRAILEETGLPPENLRLELTESAVMENVEVAIDILRRVHALGVRLSLDDFGTGYSSLSYLHRFPINTLKVDRAFVQRMEDGGENAEIVRTVATLAKALRMEVVAEGVESARQAAALKSLGCQLGQGYFFSRPLEIEAADGLVADGRWWEIPVADRAAADAFGQVRLEEGALTAVAD